MKIRRSSHTVSGVPGWHRVNSLSGLIALIRNLRESYQAWCEHCVEVVPALTPESASGLLRRPAEAIYQLLERGELHAVELGARAPLICGNSLSANSTKTQMRNKGEGK